MLWAKKSKKKNPILALLCITDKCTTDDGYDGDADDDDLNVDDER